MIDAKVWISKLEDPNTRDQYASLLMNLNMTDLNTLIAELKVIKGLDWLNTILYKQQPKPDTSKIILPKNIKPKNPKVEIKPITQPKPVEKLTPLQTLKRLITNSETLDKSQVLKWIDRLESGEQIRVI